MRNVNFTCRECGKAACGHLSSKQTVRSFCDKNCYYAFMAKNGRPYLRKPLDRECQSCGKKFRNKPTNKQRFCSISCRVKWQSALPYEEWRGKLSANVENRPRGPANHKFGKEPSHPGKAIPYVMRSGQTIKLRSTWEVEVAKYLDRREINWVYEPRRFFLGSTTYRPDFYLTDEDVYWEVKGWFHEKAKAKIGAFREMFPEERLVVITKPVYAMLAGCRMYAERRLRVHSKEHE